jgi:hypothetical protein
MDIIGTATLCCGITSTRGPRPYFSIFRHIIAGFCPLIVGREGWSVIMTNEVLPSHKGHRCVRLLRSQAPALPYYTTDRESSFRGPLLREGSNPPMSIAISWLAGSGR